MTITTNNPDSPNNQTLEQLTIALHEQIPMTRFLAIRFVELEPCRIVLSAPLQPSLNHRGTAFGPGVFTALSLAPWLLLVRMAWSMRLKAQILLRRSEFALHRPINSAFRAECDALPSLDIDQFRTEGRARLAASSRVLIDDGEPAASYAALFTILAAAASDGEGDLRLPFPEEWRT